MKSKIGDNPGFPGRMTTLDGIEINNMEMLRLTPIELHSVITWKSITVHSKSLLLEQ
jgi:hypothetical protein